MFAHQLLSLLYWQLQGSIMYICPILNILETTPVQQPIKHPHFYLSRCLDFIFFLRFHLFIHERQRGRDTGWGRSRLHAGSPMWDSIPGPPRIMPRAKGKCSTTEPPRCPRCLDFNGVQGVKVACVFHGDCYLLVWVWGPVPSYTKAFIWWMIWKSHYFASIPVLLMKH